MKRYVLLVLLAFSFQALNAQILEPVKVKTSVKVISADEVELKVTTIMDEGWHVYSINKPEDSFVIATEFNVPKSDKYTLKGDVEEPKPHVEYDPNFEEELAYHEKEVTFCQRIKVTSTEDFTVTAEFVFQTCNDRTCLTPSYEDYTFEVKGISKVKATEATADGNLKADVSTEEAQLDAADIAPGTEPEEEVIDYTGKEDTTRYDGDEEETDEDVVTNIGSTSSKSLLTIFVLSFLGGLAALLTPCVFPMIPLTVSFFTKQSKTRAKGISNAIIYGLSIIVLYTALGYAITAIFGSDALNAFSTNPYVNIAFFVLLVVFAISFFGAFEITLPSSWVNKTDQASDKGGIIGIFFMAFTLALVSFSCTGPIIGTLLFEASSGGVRGPLVGMFGFSLALALPFALFAAFPGWLNSMPKSGGWLNSVKVVLGFLELAFAFKFLSNADLVWDAEILLREHFLAIWIAIFILVGAYLLGMFRMPHDSPLEKVSVFRLFLAIFSLTFVIYLIPGMWGAPLKLISAFPPPMNYAESPGGFGKAAIISGPAVDIPKGAHPDKCPHNLSCFEDFEDGLAYAKKVNKPILIDFTGKACVNCRKMEQEVWSDPQVLKILREDVVLISLFVDLRTKLPEEEQFVSDFTGKKIKTIGNKWSEFQNRHFKTNSQPQYIILNHDSMEPLNGTTSYDPDIDLYVRWLEQGVKRFKKQSSK